MSLRPQQQRFVDEYLIDLNARQAAIRAGYSEKTAQVQSSRLLTNVKVQAAIQASMNERQVRTHITQDRALQELARIGLSDVRKLFTEGGQLRDIKSLDDETAAAIASIKVVTRPGAEVDENGNREVEYVHEVKLWDKNSALEKIAKHLGMMVERHTLDVTITDALELIASRRATTSRETAH